MKKVQSYILALLLSLLCGVFVIKERQKTTNPQVAKCQLTESNTSYGSICQHAMPPATALQGGRQCSRFGQSRPTRLLPTHGSNLKTKGKGLKAKDHRILPIVSFCFSVWQPRQGCSLSRRYYVITLRRLLC